MIALATEIVIYLGIVALVSFLLGYLVWGWGARRRLAVARAEAAEAARARTPAPPRPRPAGRTGRGP